MAVEVLTHAIDTLNMRSKAFKETVEPPKPPVIKKKNPIAKAALAARERSAKLTASVKNVGRNLRSFTSLFRGVTAVVYGYAFSAGIYFYVYAKLRDHSYSWCEKRNNA